MHLGGSSLLALARLPESAGPEPLSGRLRLSERRGRLKCVCFVEFGTKRGLFLYQGDKIGIITPSRCQLGLYKRYTLHFISLAQNLELQV